MPALPALPAVDATRARAIASVGQILSGLLVMLGVLGLLRGGVSGFGEDARNVLIFDLHPASSLVHLALGLVGVAMVTRADRARRYLVGVGALLVAWGLVSPLLADSPRELFVADAALIVLYLLAGAVALVVALVPSRGGAVATPPPEPTPPPPSDAPERTG